MMSQVEHTPVEQSHIVVVDDHQLFIDGIRLVLGTLPQNITVSTFGAVSDALNFIEDRTDIDLIMLDISMPDLDGLAFLSALKNRQILVPTVVVSATENLRKVKDALSLGAFGFIPKSHSSQEVAKAIEVVLQGNIYLPEKMVTQLAKLDTPAGRPGRKSDSHKNRFGISRRQLDVLKLVAKGYSNKQIAMALYLSEHTVKSHMSKLFQLIGVDNRTACVRLAQEHGLIEEN